MSRKKRNLKFIRVKNNLRRGFVSFHVFEKVSNEFSVDYNYLNNLREITKKSLLKNYKLDIEKYPFATISLDSGYIDDDILKDLFTWKCSINLIGK